MPIFIDFVVGFMSCRYMLEALGIARAVLTCFSNRLLGRLHGAEGTLEALMGVAFQWEALIKEALASRRVGFIPNQDWFRSKFLDRSRLSELLKDGVRCLAFDEAFTLHPLLVDVLLSMADDWGCMTFSAGEILQITARTDIKWMNAGWHEAYAFQMATWRSLEQAGRLVYLRLSHNHRLLPGQNAMLQRVSGCVTWKLKDRIYILEIRCLKGVAAHAWSRHNVTDM